MNDEASFLKAIANDPDDTARLAFADWLEERDDPRSAWVRDPAIFRWMGPTGGSPVPALIEALGRDDWQHRGEAVRVLARIGAPAVGELLKTIESGSELSAEEAGRALSEMKADDVLPILPRLLELVDHEEEHIFGAAIHALVAVGPAAVPALPALKRQLPGGYEHSDSRIAEHVVEVLTRMGKAALPAVRGLMEQFVYPETKAYAALTAIGPEVAPEILKHLSALDSELVLRAADPLIALGSDVVPLLREALTHDDDNVRVVAALALADTDPETALPHLLESLQNQYWGELDESTLFGAIGRMGATGKPAVPVLRRLLEEGRHNEYEIGRTLKALEAEEEILQDLVNQLKDRNSRQRNSALTALEELAVSSPDMIDAVLSCLTDEDRYVRLRAVELLKKLIALGRREDIIAAITPLLHDTDEAVRCAAIRFAWQNDFPDLISELFTSTESSEATVRAAAVDALGRVSGATSQTAEVLLRALADPDHNVRLHAVDAIVTRQDVFKHAKNRILELLEDPNTPYSAELTRLLEEVDCPAHEKVRLSRRFLTREYEGNAWRVYNLLGVIELTPLTLDEFQAIMPTLVRNVEQDNLNSTYAARVLGRVGNPGVSSLTALLQHKDDRVRISAARGLEAAGVAALPALESLSGCLTSSNDYLRVTAAEAIGSIGPKAALARTALRTLLRDRTPNGRKAAIDALAKLGPDPEALQDVVALVRDDNQAVREAVIKAIRQLTTPKSAVAILHNALVGADESMQGLIEDELTTLETPDTRTHPLVVQR